MSILKNKQRKPYLVKEVGEWRFSFHYKEGSIDKTFLLIMSTSGIFNCRIGGNTHAYGYLLAAAKQGLDAQLQGYAVTLYVPAMAMTQDAGLTADVQKAINKWMKRKEAEAKSAAAAVTDSEEMASQAFMDEVAAYADATPKERKKMRKADKAALREVLNEKDSENGE